MKLKPIILGLSSQMSAESREPEEDTLTEVLELPLTNYNTETESIEHSTTTMLQKSSE